MTQLEVYNQLYLENFMRLCMRNLTLSGKDTNWCSRQAHILAVQHTWYWFNHQDQFIDACCCLKAK